MCVFSTQIMSMCYMLLTDAESECVNSHAVHTEAAISDEVGSHHHHL